MTGDLEHTADRWRLRFVRKLAHSQEKVWRAITEPEHLTAWFPQRIEGDWAVGASLRFEHPGKGFPGFDGQVLALVPPRLLEFRWGTDTLRFEIVPDGAGCQLTLMHTFDQQGKGARDGAGWHLCLDMLEHHLDGTTPPWAPREHWAQVHEAYVAKFGPEASTIGPPKTADRRDADDEQRA